MGPVMEGVNGVLKRLFEARKKKGYSQADIAARLNISKDAYRKMENQQSPMSLERFIKVCSVLEISFLTLLDETAEDTQAREFQARIMRLDLRLMELKSEREEQWLVINKLIQLLAIENKKSAKLINRS
jgi:transcriptional regulator with XRE-family HTH domain